MCRPRVRGSTPPDPTWDVEGLDPTSSHLPVTRILLGCSHGDLDRVLGVRTFSDPQLEVATNVRPSTPETVGPKCESPYESGPRRVGGDRRTAGRSDTLSRRHGRGPRRTSRESKHQRTRRSCSSPTQSDTTRLRRGPVRGPGRKEVSLRDPGRVGPGLPCLSTGVSLRTWESGV